MGAIPKEPRQKMINVMYLILTAMLALNVANEVITSFKVVNKSLETSNEVITEGNNTLYNSLADKLNDPQTAERAQKWEAKAQEVKRLSGEMYTYIDGLKQQLKEQAGLKIMDDGTEDYREDDLDASTRMFDKNGLGPEFQKKLDDYKEQMLALDPEIAKHFGNSFPVNTDTKDFKSREGKSKDFTETYFYMTPAVAALTVLTKFQNNVKSAESEAVTVCHNAVGAVKVVYDEFVPLVGQTSNYLMPGDKMTITAGVGAYSSAAKPTITIGGQAVALGSDGRAEYSVTATGSGSHTIPVKVTYTKPDGTPETKEYPVQYTVGTPGGTAVSLDKMNVLYIGLENPMTINSGTGWDKTRVSISGAGATMKNVGGAGHYQVDVKNVGTATLTVNADGKVSQHEFRVKQVPDPKLMIGPSDGGKIQSVVFKNQQFARAALNDFIYNYQYNIVSATVYFSGANFSNVQTSNIKGGSLAGLSDNMSKCIPGTLVTFDNIKVQGPGGPVKSIPTVTFVLQ